MKKIMVVTCALLLSCFACKKAKGPANGNSVQPNNHRDSTVQVTAVINGANWKTDSAWGYNVKYSGNDSGIANLMITATDEKDPKNLTTLQFNITNYRGPSEYPVSPPLNTATYYVGNIRHFATKGTIVVTSDTAYALKGTFTFTADTITVTNGIFNVALP